MELADHPDVSAMRLSIVYPLDEGLSQSMTNASSASLRKMAYSNSVRVRPLDWLLSVSQAPLPEIRMSTVKQLMKVSFQN